MSERSGTAAPALRTAAAGAACGSCLLVPAGAAATANRGVEVNTAKRQDRISAIPAWLRRGRVVGAARADRHRVDAGCEHDVGRFEHAAAAATTTAVLAARAAASHEEDAARGASRDGERAVSKELHDRGLVFEDGLCHARARHFDGRWCVFRHCMAHRRRTKRSECKQC